jgi:hypothetical protein
MTNTTSVGATKIHVPTVGEALKIADELHTQLAGTSQVPAEDIFLMLVEAMAFANDGHDTKANAAIDRAIIAAETRRQQGTFGGLQDVRLWLIVATVYAIQGKVADSEEALREAIRSTQRATEFSGETEVLFWASIANVQAINSRHTS